MPNPAVQVIIWATLVVVLQMIGAAMLAPVLVLLLSIAVLFSAARLRLLLRRTRWIMFSLLLIYACATPGAPLFEPLREYGPTVEGLQDGLLQLGRLIGVLASLSILLSRLDRQKLVGALYALAYPLRFVGMARERIAVRLALTLHYSESAMLDTNADWRCSMEGLLAPVAVEQPGVEIPVLRFALADILFLMAVFAALVLVIL